MSQDVASSKQPLISTALEAKADQDQNQQRKCGVHRLPEPKEETEVVDELDGGDDRRDRKPKEKKRSVDAVVEAYLDEHPAFLDDYVKRKVSRRQLEQWLFLPFTTTTSEAAAADLGQGGRANDKTNAAPASSKLPWKKQHLLAHSSDSSLNKTGGLLSSCVRRGQLPETAGSSGHERQRSHSFTPLRKLSATTFEAGGLATPILATTSDGQPSFLRTVSVTSAASAKTSSSSSNSCPLRFDDHDRAGAIKNRRDILFTLLPDILSQRTDLISFASVLMKSANLLMGQASKVDLLLLKTPNSFNGTAFVMKGAEAVTQRPDAAFIIRNNPLLKSVLTSPQVLNIKEGLDILLDDDHADDNHDNVGLGINNALLGPLYTPEGNETIGCLQLYDKVGGFSVEDESIFAHLLSLASIGFCNLMLQQEMRLELARSEVFLELARTVFREPSRLEATMLIILTNFLSLIDCQRCQISLCDRERPSVFKRVFDLQREDLTKELEAPYENRLPLKGDISESVAISGQKINLGKDQLLDDEECHSFLSLAIRDPDGIVGVISLANKEAVTSDTTQTTESSNCIFTNNDERFVEAFAVFCGMAIRNAADYERAVVSEAKLQVAFEVMNFQATSDVDNASYLAGLSVSAASSTHVDSFQFNYLKMDDDATLTATIRMFIDLGLLKRFGIEYNTLCRWLLTVKRNYRNESVQYHNWFHAFNVTQMMFSMLLKTSWNWKFSTIDVLGLIVACISHDLDHRGTNNSFQHKMNNPLAKLYSTSTLERHHLNQCLLILTLKGNKILDNLTKDEYTETLAVIERSILATDLALHFRDAPALSTLASKINQCPEKLETLLEENPKGKHLMQAGMMTAADLGNATKPWDVHHHVSQLIAEEFWTQGDIERKEFNLNPQPMFDRSVALRDSQLDFLDKTCIPLYEDMGRFSAELQPLLDGCRANRQRWANHHSNEVTKSSKTETEIDVEQARNL